MRAAKAGVHILCEKPLAVTAGDCRKMLRAAELSCVKLMVAYRLHFEACNLQTIALLHSGRLGEPRLFHSVFTQQVRSGDIRLKSQLGGGPLYDIGVYCINAARYLFRDEPMEVTAMVGRGNDRRFHNVEESAGAGLRFPTIAWPPSPAASARRMPPCMKSWGRKAGCASSRHTNISAA